MPRSLERTLRRGTFRIACDTAFDQVIDACAAAPRAGQEGSWITGAMRQAYRRLHRLGFAHSAEAWRGDQLAGGLYGVSLGGMFFGESMFAREPNASKAAFVVLVRQLLHWGITLIDCQVATGHLVRFGAREWPRARFLTALAAALEVPTRQGSWRGALFGDVGVSTPAHP